MFNTRRAVEFVQRSGESYSKWRCSVRLRILSPMEIQTIIVPYDSAHRNLRMGAGPLRLFEAAVEPLLRERSVWVHADCVEATDGFQTEIATAFHLNRLVAERVRAAVQTNRFPLLLSGNCNTALGGIAGSGAKRPRVIWLDAHGDFNTPETTTSGFFDGMGLAVVAGLCWTNLARSIPGFERVRGDHILHVGGRDSSPVEICNMRETGVQVCTAAAINSEGARVVLGPAFEALHDKVPSVYLHLDLDVIDASEARATVFSPPGGLSTATVAYVLGLISETFNVVGLGVSSYDPAVDRDDRTLQAAGDLLRIVLSKIWK